METEAAIVEECLQAFYAGGRSWQLFVRRFVPDGLPRSFQSIQSQALAAGKAAGEQGDQRREALGLGAAMALAFFTQIEVEHELRKRFASAWLESRQPPPRLDVAVMALNALGKDYLPIRSVLREAMTEVLVALNGSEPALRILYASARNCGIDIEELLR